MKAVKRNILLNPGPATTTDTVKFAQVVADICPRETEFGELMEFISRSLTNFVADTERYTTVLFGGSGTAVVEAVISSVIGNKTALIINNGAYGERMCKIADAYHINYIEFKSDSISPIDWEKLEACISAEPADSISHLCIVHNETTTGLLNDIRIAGEICKKYDIEMIVDAMSSYAAIPIDMEKENISYLMASSNKNLQGMAGIGFVIANISNLENTAAIPPRNFYLNLYAQYNYFKKNYQMRFTPPVQTLYALKQAIIETQAESIEKRYQRYSESWATLIDGLEALGLTYLVPPKHHSRIITTIVEPGYPGYHFNDLHDDLYDKGYTIYPGKLYDLDTFRIANIGAIDKTDIHRFLVELKHYFEKIGFTKTLARVKHLKNNILQERH